jgi:nucleotide-binding universal stress UspA family protein
MRTVLAASDLSHRSDRAVAQATYLAARLGCRLIVVHVVDDQLPTAVFDAEREQALRSLEEMAARLESSTSMDLALHTS